MDVIPMKANYVMVKMWEWTSIISKIQENDFLREIVLTAF